MTNLNFDDWKSDYADEDMSQQSAFQHVGTYDPNPIWVNSDPDVLKGLMAWKRRIDTPWAYRTQ